MNEAFIIDAVRSPIGRCSGTVSGIHPADLAAHTYRAMIALLT